MMMTRIFTDLLINTFFFDLNVTMNLYMYICIRSIVIGNLKIIRYERSLLLNISCTKIHVYVATFGIEYLRATTYYYYYYIR